MWHQFSTWSGLTAVVALGFALGWLLFGTAMLKRWGWEPSPTALMLGRRIGCIYLGLAYLFFAVRAAPPSELRTLLTQAAMLLLALVAIHGIHAYRRREAGPVILASVAGEIVLILGYANVLAHQSP